MNDTWQKREESTVIMNRVKIELFIIKIYNIILNILYYIYNIIWLVYYLWQYIIIKYIFYLAGKALPKIPLILCKWSDFGGAPDKDETIKETAIRECYEETSGLLGTLSEIRSCLENNYVTCINTYRYKTFIMEIKYDETLPKKFEDIYNDVYNNNPESLLKHDGKMRKTWQWVELKDLKEFSNQARFFIKR